VLDQEKVRRRDYRIKGCNKKLKIKRTKCGRQTLKRNGRRIKERKGERKALNP
jgi:hypothetical protein